MILGGLVLVAISFYTSFTFLIYSAIIIILGIIILLNKNEDKIELIKNTGGKK